MFGDTAVYLLSVLDLGSCRDRFHKKGVFIIKENCLPVSRSYESLSKFGALTVCSKINILYCTLCIFLHSAPSNRTLVSVTIFYTKKS